MDTAKYIGMDVHKEAISIAVLNSSGKLVMESTIETKASTIRQFFQGLSGSLHVSGKCAHRDLEGKVWNQTDCKRFTEA
jgi:ethanolamine utilization microcompartment shell protein EutS